MGRFNPSRRNFVKKSISGIGLGFLACQRFPSPALAEDAKTLEKLNRQQILELLSELSQLDIKCKSDSSISDASRFELFIIDLMN